MRRCFDVAGRLTDGNSSAIAPAVISCRSRSSSRMRRRDRSDSAPNARSSVDELTECVHVAVGPAGLEAVEHVADGLAEALVAVVEQLHQRAVVECGEPNGHAGGAEPVRTLPQLLERDLVAGI